jgi:serine/threonine protein kinase
VHRKRAFSYRDLLFHARSFAAAMMYLHEEADARGMVIHRDLKVRNMCKHRAVVA